MHSAARELPQRSTLGVGRPSGPVTSRIWRLVLPLLPLRAKLLFQQPKRHLRVNNRQLRADAQAYKQGRATPSYLKSRLLYALIVNLPSPIKHWYAVPTADDLNVPIELYVGLIRLSIETVQHGIDGRFYFDWLPRPRIAWSASTSALEPMSALLDNALTGLEEIPHAELPQGVTVPPPQPTPGVQPIADSARLAGYETNVQIGQPASLSSVTFFVPNCPTPVNGEPITDGPGTWSGRMRMQGGGWEVELDAPRENNKIVNWLRERGGSAITHTGRLRRQDGSDFTVDEATDTLWLLETVLSFAAGRRIACLLPVGYDGSGAPIWSEWQMPLIDPWDRGQEVTDLWHVEHWQELFERFAAVWAIPFERKVMYRAVRLFLNARNDDVPELAVSTVQSALELLAYTYLVEDHKILSDAQYKPPAHKNLSNYLSYCQIDLQVPPALAHLAAAA